MLRKKFFNLSITTMVVMLLNWTLTILLPYKGIPIFPYSNISVSEKKSIIRVFFRYCVNLRDGIK